MKFGIDVSMFIDADILKYKPDFVMIRSGEGGMRDPKTEYYASICRQNEIPYGYYHVLRLNDYTLNENIASVKDAINRSGRPSMGVWCDVETPSAFNDEAINKFCKEFENVGLYAGIYAGVNELRKGKIKAPNYDKWAAFYGTNSGKIEDFSAEDKEIISKLGNFWQYHGSNSSPDLDVCFIDDLTVFAGKLEEINIKADLIEDLKAIQKRVNVIQLRLEDLLRKVENDL